jgi:Tol biopolymer transport system component
VKPIAVVDQAAGRPSSGAVLLGEARRHKRLLAVLLGGLALMVVVLATYFSKLSRHGMEWNLQAMKITRVTQSGNATNVAISPDGRYVVYVLRDGEKQSLNVRQVATGSDVQVLPPDEVVIFNLTFSPDGNYIDFIRSEKNNLFNTFLYQMPVLGGTPRLLIHGGVDGGNSYSPDGKAFAFLRVRPADHTFDVFIANSDGSRERVLATRPGYFYGPAWSPDGKTLALATGDMTKTLRTTLSAISLSNGSLREIYSTPDAMGRPRWLPDGSGLLVPIGSADQGYKGQLWYISFPSGETHRLTNDLMDYQLCCLDLTQDGKTLVDTELTTVSDLWVAPAADAARAKQITVKEPIVGALSWTPDDRIVFANGNGNLVALNANGSGRTLLAPNERPNWAPSACGDGRYIVYAGYREQKLGIWRIETDGSNPVRIADETFAIGPQCSLDGKWVVYLRGPSWTPVRVATTGESPPEVLVKDSVAEAATVLSGGGGMAAEISPNGKLIAYLT